MSAAKSYLTLYRKLRPKLFRDVVGQEHITRTLINQLRSSRVSHAYLICGTRGTGKTSTAKIFARALNCLSPEDGEPCNKCKMCLDILAQRSVNVIEIDAASNNGVDNIREIREEVRYAPTEGIYKVYIIDEVHMLSTGAFNALLKTLEEPPDHVVFILATTDPQKVPATIHSRCQRFDFKRIGQADMCQTISVYADRENLSINADALAYLASVSDGSMRDALSILDQCSSFYMNETITKDKVIDVVGSVDDRVFFDISDALYRRDLVSCLQIVKELNIDGRDIGQFVTELLTHLRNTLVASVANNEGTVLDLSEETVAKLRGQGKAIGTEILIGYVNAFSLLAGQLRYASNERILLETTCVRLCNPSAVDSGDTVFMRLKKLEDEIAAIGTEHKRVALPEKKGEDIQNVKHGKVKKAVPDDIRIVQENWENFVSSFDNPLRSFLSMTTGGYLDGNLLIIVTKDIGTLEILKGRQEQLCARLTEDYHADFTLSLMTQDEYDSKHRELYGVSDEVVGFDEFIKNNIDMKIEFI